MLESENDEDFKAMLKAELSEAKEKEEVLKNEIKLLLLPKDPNDEKNVMQGFPSFLFYTEQAAFFCVFL